MKIKRYCKFIKESVYGDKGMAYDDINDIMYYVTDEFPELDFSVENALQSSIIEVDEKSFIVEFYTIGIESQIYMPLLHYIEPRINNLIPDINSQLKKFGLEVFYSDFGLTDAYYELVITEIGHKPEFISERYDKYGNGK